MVATLIDLVISSCQDRRSSCIILHPIRRSIQLRSSPAKLGSGPSGAEEICAMFLRFRTLESECDTPLVGLQGRELIRPDSSTVKCKMEETHTHTSCSKVVKDKHTFSICIASRRAWSKHHNESFYSFSFSSSHIPVTPGVPTSSTDLRCLWWTVTSGRCMESTEESMAITSVSTQKSTGLDVVSAQSLRQRIPKTKTIPRTIPALKTSGPLVLPVAHIVKVGPCLQQILLTKRGTV